MSVWDWVHAYGEEAAASGDRDRARLIQLHESAGRYCRSNPDIMLGLLGEGRALAERLGEPWWVLFFDHWRLQCLLNYKGDYTGAVDLAVRATLEARKPVNAALPQRVCLHEDLIYAYVGVDPEGHAEKIAQALDYMGREVGPELECRYCVQHCRTQFALRRGRLEEARAEALRLLALTDAEPNRGTADHFATDAYADLCAAAHGLGDWEALRGWADVGEETARRQDDMQVELARFLAWQALLARRDGNEAGAQRLARGARSRVRRVKSFPGESYFDALAAFHEQGGELEVALAVRDAELAAVAGKGRLDHEARCHLKRCRVLARLGRLGEAERAAAREAAGRLREPQKYLEELEKIERA